MKYTANHPPVFIKEEKEDKFKNASFSDVYPKDYV